MVLLSLLFLVVGRVYEEREGFENFGVVLSRRVFDDIRVAFRFLSSNIMFIGVVVDLEEVPVLPFLLYLGLQL